jgi:flagellar biosynthesis protein FlhF
MRVKKYLVNSMPEAMALIRAELGPDAVILHQNKVRGAGLLGFLKRSRLEVIAAVDTDLRDFPRPTPVTDLSIQAMQNELASLKDTLARVANGSPADNGRTATDSAQPPRIASLDDWYRRLLENGVTARLAQRITQSVADELNRWTLDNHRVLNEHLHYYLGRLLRPPTPIIAASGQPHVLFIVGPTGVGKTTTLAKLAAQFAYPGHSRARTMMITADTFRVAAIPQIVTFGEILGVPVKVAYTPDQLVSLINDHQHYELILVDTPGRSQHAAGEVAALSNFLHAAYDQCDAVQKSMYLAMAAGTKYEDMQHIVNGFSRMPLDGLIFTKIDETATLGAAYTLACETELPLSYLTTGQRVPEDIEVATVERLVDLLVGSVPDNVRSIRAREWNHA